MTPPRLILCKASAGSGKTFTLAKSFLRIILERPQEYDRILAVTFTNKATEEMKSRILSYLTEISQLEKEEDVSKSAIATILIKEMEGWDFQRLAIAGKAALSNILHDYSHFSIMTIDRFFQRIIRSFIHELKLSYAANVSMDNDIALEQAVAALLDEYSQDPDLPLNKWLREISLDRMDEGKKWQPTDTIKSLSKELFKENLLESGAEYPIEKIEPFYRELRKMQAVFKKAVQQMAEEVLERIAFHGMENKFSNGYIPKQTAKFLTDPTHPGYSSSSVNAINDGVLPFAKSVQKENQYPAYEQAWLNDIQPACQKLLQFFESNIVDYKTATAILKHLQSLALLSDVKTKIREYREKEGVMLISDSTQLINKIVSHSDAPFLYEKLGNKYRYILLDEFQDTSSMQWKNMLPLLLEILSHRESCQVLIVGDAKQSIYRWRNGNLQLILSKVKEDLSIFWQDEESEMVLDSNYRSREEVVAFNNAIFEPMAQVATTYLEIEHGVHPLETPLYPILDQLYGNDDARQQAMKKGGGFVSVRFFPETSNRKKKTEEEEDSLDEQLIPEQKTYLKTLLEQLVQEQGYQYADICLLVRRNIEAIEMAAMLQEWKYPVMTAEAMLFTHHPGINLVTDAMRYLLHPDEPLFLTAFIYAYARYHDKSDNNLLQQPVVLQYLKEWMPEISDVNQQSKLRALELPELILQLFLILGIQSDRDAYTEQYLDLVRGYKSSVYDTSLQDFLQWWDSKSLSVKVSGQVDAIQILTIHKAKGLEFKVVIIPFADWKVVDKSPLRQPVLWPEAPDQPPFDRFSTYPVSFNDAKGSLFDLAYQEEVMLQASDCFNMAYVAFTRAVEQLYIMAGIPEKEASRTEKPGTIGKLLYTCLQSMEPQAWDGLTYKRGQIPVRINQASTTTTHPNTFEIRPSAANKIQSVDLKVPKYYSHEQIIGQAMHDMIAAYQKGADIDLLVQNIAIHYSLEEADQLSLKTRLQHFLTHPDVEKLYQTTGRVIMERDIFYHGQQLRFDMLVLEEKEGKLYDFKTGTGDPKNIEQIKEYREALESGGIKISEAALIYIASDGTPQFEYLK